MRIEDLERTYEVSDEEGLNSVLLKRYASGVNAFWLSHDPSKYPALLIMVNGELASLHYFPKDRHPGFRSIGSMEKLESGGTTTFFMDSVHEAMPIPNESVVDVSTGQSAAKEFLASANLPSSVQWFEL